MQVYNNITNNTSKKVNWEIHNEKHNKGACLGGQHCWLYFELQLSIK